MTPSTAQARVLVDELARGGVRHAVIAPGSRSAPLALAFDAHPGVATHVEIDERSAGFLALGVGRAGGVPAAVVCSSGTAAVNLHPAVVEADAARVPLILLTADRPPELRDTGANQTIAQPGLYGGAPRWAVDVPVAEPGDGQVGLWRSLATRAVAEALGPPAGPVHVNVGLRDPLIPEDDVVWAEVPGGRADGAPWTRRTAGLAVPAPAVADEVAALVADAPRGVLVLGDVEVDPVVATGFAAAAGWPVIAEPLSGARTGDHVASTSDLLLADDGFAGAHVPDVAVVAGRPVLTRAVRRWLDRIATTVLVDADGAWLDPGRTVARIVRADPSALLRDVLARLDGPRTTTHFLAQWQHAERAARAAVDGLLDARTEPSEPRTARDLAAVLPDGALLVVGSSMPVRDLSSVMRPRTGLRVLGNRGASGIDGFVSTALGAALAHDGPVAALCGDLSLLHDQNGFLLADRDGIDVVFVVVNNDGGGIFSLLEARDVQGFERLFGTPHGIGMASLAATYGLAYHPLVRAGDLGELVGAALGGGGIHLIEVRTDRDANAALHAELATAVAKALTA